MRQCAIPQSVRRTLCFFAPGVAFVMKLCYFIHDCTDFSCEVSTIKRFFLLLALLLALTTCALAADGTITDLRADCLLSASGSCQVTETVTVEFTGSAQSLTLPLGANAKHGAVAGYHAKKVTEDGYTLLRLEDAAGFSGSRTFTVTYTLSGLVSEADGAQTLTLPLLCPKWDYPIEHFSFTVSLPKETEAVPAFASGYYGDVIEDYMTTVRQGAVLRGELDTALKDHESLQMTLDLGARYFSGTYSGWSANWLSGYLSIAVDPQGHVSLLRHMYMGNERRGLEVRLFSALFARADRCDGASLHYKNTAKSAMGALGRYWARRLYTRTSGNPLVMRALTCLSTGIAVLSAASLLLPVLPLRALLLILCFAAGVGLSILVQRAAMHWYLRSIPALALGGLGGVVLLLLGNLSGTFLLALLAVGLSVLTGVLTRHGGQRSRAGSQLLGQVLGFRRFLMRVSPSHLAMRLQRDPQYFYRTLPYAEAMGLGAAFARKFGDTELEPCEWYNEPNLPRTASGFYEKLQETLRLLDFSIRY